jgi:Spy/CpxP family protein refolding chaperone
MMKRFGFAMAMAAALPFVAQAQEPAVTTRRQQADGAVFARAQCLVNAVGELELRLQTMRIDGNTVALDTARSTAQAGGGRGRSATGGAARSGGAGTGEPVARSGGAGTGTAQAGARARSGGQGAPAPDRAPGGRGGAPAQAGGTGARSGGARGGADPANAGRFATAADAYFAAMGGVRPGTASFEQSLFTAPQVLARAEAIQLTDAQRATINNEVSRLMSQTAELGRSVEVEQMTLTDLLAQRPIDDAAATAQLTRLLELEAQVKHLHFLSLVQIKNTLTETQVAQLNQMMGRC